VRRIGLTGGIGSGKSTVAQAMVRCGAALVDADAIARQLTQAGGLAMPVLAQAFGAAAVTAEGALNRDHMRSLAFTDPAAKARLEALLHPMIGAESARQAALADAAGAPLIIFDVPLLTESRHWRERVDRVLVVDCAEATQAARVARRPGWTLEAAQAVIAQQATRMQRRAIADAVIYNDGVTLLELQQQVQVLWALWVPADRPPGLPGD
jgi:dephospho-CoA kinase